MTNNRRPRYLRAVIGSFAGAFLGYLGFAMLTKIGVYAMVVPGAMTGLGCGAQSGTKSIPLGLYAAALAFIVSVLIEWHFFPFVADESLPYFVSNLDGLSRLTKVMFGFGTFAGFWFGRGR